MSNEKWKMENDKWKIVKLFFSIAAIVACLIVIWINAQVGLSKLLAKYAIFNRNLEAANTSVSLAPSDPEAHRVRAAVLYRSSQPQEAAQELEQAVRLRPRDDHLWLELAMIRDELHDAPGAAVAFNESIRLAPFYAHPRWQRGNFLLRRHRLEEAFADLRQAAASNPAFVPNLIDLAWGVSGGDIQTAERLIQANDAHTRSLFGAYLAKKGKSREAAEQLALAGQVPEQMRTQLVRDLISAKAFDQAYKIWNSSGHETAMIHDGGFESSLNFDESGFGWRVSRSTQGAKLVSESSHSHTGSRSLLIEFRGDSNPDSTLISQLILAEASRRYRINFSARTRDIVTGGLPLVVVSDAVSSIRLGESVPLRPDIADWRTLSVEFETGATTPAVVLSIQRRGCSSGPCPIFGSLWLDSFSMEPL